MATSNQMHSRYRDFMRRYHQEVADPHLVHGMAWLVDGPSSAGGASTFGSDPDEEEIISREWFQNAKRALLASDGVGTIDQALMSVLNVKFGFLRLFALSSKTLIIDEVHAYDEYMTVLIERLLQWCRALSIPVIMLSATLSAAQKSRLLAAYTGADPQCASAEVQPYPLLTFAPLEGQAIEREVAADHRLDRRIEVRRHPGMLDDVQAVAQLAIEQTDAGGCACVFMNTVKQAQAVYRELKRLVEGSELEADILLFHSRYRAERRGQIENEVVGLFGKESGGNDSPSRPRRAILVATQVVEQSLDLDFDVMISQLAPIDLLLQRCGRLWRHERGPRPTGSTPTMHILLPDPQSLDLGLTGRIYHAEPLLRTIALLSARDWFDVPADLRALVEGCYGGAPIPPGVIPDDLLDAAAQSRAELLGDYGQRARTHLIPEPNPRVFELAEMPRPVGEHDDGERTSYFRAQTRIGGDTRSVLILHDPEMVVQTRSARPPDRGALQSLFLQEVKVPGWWLNDLVPGVGFDPLVDGPRWLRGRTVMAMTGGQWQGTRNGRTVTISDDPELGLTMTMEESNGSV